MLSRVSTSALNGIQALPVDVEVEVRGGAPRFTIIGHADNAVQESKDRVVSAIRSSGIELPGGTVLVNLAPADLKKMGSSFDISIALGILAASHQLDSKVLESVSVHGELSLDGRINKVRGIVARVISAKQNGADTVVVPYENRYEASLIEGVRVIAVNSLIELVRYLKGDAEPAAYKFERDTTAEILRFKSLDDIWGQERAKRALMIAAAAGHNLLLIGPPGCGKSMLAQAFPFLLPSLTQDQILEVTKIHSAMGLPVDAYLQGLPPYRAPHHVISDVGLVGGGTVPKPGELTLAHCGVLFLDEFPEFRRSTLEALRSPLETGHVRVVRAGGSVEFPAKSQLIAAMNPCPCGRLGVEGVECACSFGDIQRYLKKLSQPILDRIDLHVELDAVPLSVIVNQEVTNKVTHSECKDRVSAARAIQIKRQGKLNSDLSGKELKEIVALDQDCTALLEKAAKKIGLSARSYVRVLRIARTIADFEGEEIVGKNEIAEALSFRSLERMQKYLS